MVSRRVILSLIATVIVPFAAIADGPAVSGQNAKLSAEGGVRNSDGTFLALGSYSLPVGTDLGLQMDGALGTIDDKIMGGGGLHFFTRDPDAYLFGVYGSYHSWNSIDIWRVAAEAEVYINRFTFGGIAGYENVDVPGFSNGLAVIDQDDAHFFTNLQLAYYPVDNLKLAGGYRYVSEASLGTADAEYLIQDAGAPVSIFARGDFGEAEFNRVMGGLRVYFGADPNKSLIERHRTEDPRNYVPEFPVLQTRNASNGSSTPSTPPQCQIDDDYIVTNVANGECICPSGTSYAGGAPQTVSGGLYSCGNLD